MADITTASERDYITHVSGKPYAWHRTFEHDGYRFHHVEPMYQDATHSITIRRKVSDSIWLTPIDETYSINIGFEDGLPSYLEGIRHYYSYSEGILFSVRMRDGECVVVLNPCDAPAFQKLFELLGIRLGEIIKDDGWVAYYRLAN